jgi:hypothetical protein
MKRILFSLLAFRVALFLTFRSSSAAETPKWVAIAVSADGTARPAAVLRANKIKFVSLGGGRKSMPGVTISVPADRTSEALELLAKAVKADGLKLTLLTSKADRYVVVTPDSVLESKKDRSFQNLQR